MKITSSSINSKQNASFYLANYSQHPMILNHSQWIPSISINLYLLIINDSWMIIQWFKVYLGSLEYKTLKYMLLLIFFEYISLLYFERKSTNDSTINVHYQTLPKQKHAYLIFMTVS